MLELSDRDLKAGIIKMPQQAITNRLETNEKKRKMSVKKSLNNNNKRRYKEKPNEDFGTKIIQQLVKKIQWVCSITEWRE